MHDFVLKQSIPGSHFIDIFLYFTFFSGDHCMLPSLHMYGNSD